MRADDYILERARQDFEEGLAHVRETIHASHGRLVAASLDALVSGAVAALELRHRIDDDVTFLCGLAHEVAGGADPEALAREHLPRVLRLKQLALIAREKEPEFDVILDIARTNFAKRLPDLALMVSVENPTSYEDIVRRAFPDRSVVVTMVAENRAFTLAIVDHLEANPHLLRAPKALAPRMAHTARDMIEWLAARVMIGIGEIYADDPA